MCSFVVLTDELRPSGGPVQTEIDPRNLIGRKAFDRNGVKIGTVDEVYLDDATGVPEWAAICPPNRNSSSTTTTASTSPLLPRSRTTTSASWPAPTTADPSGAWLLR